jgi:hypothetical protein
MYSPTSASLLAVVKSATALDHTLAGAYSSSAQLSLRLHEIYQKASASREAIRLEQERIKAERMMVFRAMLVGIHPPSPETLDKIKKAGARSLTKTGMPDKKSLSPEELRMRREVKEARARAKAEEQARIRRENAAMRARIKNKAAATDNDVSDDATGMARRKAAAEAQARREALQQKMAEQNEAMRRRLLNTGAATDNDVSDDAVGVARREAAKAAKLRKMEAARQLRLENQELFSMIANTGAATDNDVSDDAIGMARRAAAKDAKDRKAYEEAMRQAENAAFRDMTRNTKAFTDNDVSDDATGAARRRQAALAKGNKDEAARALARENQALVMRLDTASAKKKKRSPKQSPKSDKGSKVFLAHAPAPAEVIPEIPPPVFVETRSPPRQQEKPPEFRPDLAVKMDPSKKHLEREAQMEAWMQKLELEAAAETQTGDANDDWDDGHLSGRPLW